MDRLSAPSPDSMNDEQLRVRQAIIAGPRGKVEGPLGLWLHSPMLAERAQALGAFCRYGTTLPPRLSELAIISCGAVWQAGFEWAVHAPLAEQAGIDPAIIEDIRCGRAPHFARDDERVVHVFSNQLTGRHRVDDDIYEQAIALLGAKGIVELVGICGYYGLICITINAFRIPVPEPGGDPFAQGAPAGGA